MTSFFTRWSEGVILAPMVEGWLKSGGMSPGWRAIGISLRGLVRPVAASGELYAVAPALIGSPSHEGRPPQPLHGVRRARLAGGPGRPDGRRGSRRVRPDRSRHPPGPPGGPAGGRAPGNRADLG